MEPMKTGIPKICVLGGGIIGLSTAVAILENIPRVKVTVMAELFTPNTTSDGAAGLWMPYLLGSDTPEATQRYWLKKTFEYLKKLYASEESSNVGISLVTGYCLSESDKDESLWLDVVFGYRPMQSQELQMFGVQKGFAFTTFITECSKLLPFLTSRLQSFGGNLLQRKVQRLTELANDYDIVVNCTGTWAKYIADDPAMYPIRGQIMRVFAPWVKMFIISDDYYIIPNIESVVLGGTHQENNWNLTATSADRNNILTNCYKFMPSLKNAKVIKDWVGLRPGRNCVRLERENIQCGPKTLQTIHNYGHGGCGVTLFWGCALNAVQLIQETLNNTGNKTTTSSVPKSRI